MYNYKYFDISQMKKVGGLIAPSEFEPMLKEMCVDRRKQKLPEGFQMCQN